MISFSIASYSRPVVQQPIDIRAQVIDLANDPYLAANLDRLMYAIYSRISNGYKRGSVVVREVAEEFGIDEEILRAVYDHEVAEMAEAGCL
jgi:hypothetical protein